MREPSKAEILMEVQLKELITQYPASGAIDKEFRFYPPRRWRFDYALVTNGKSIAIEIDGGSFINGRHNRGSGKLKDDEKFNHAALLGWLVLRFSPKQVEKGEAIEFVKRVLDA